MFWFAVIFVMFWLAFSLALEVFLCCLVFRSASYGEMSIECAVAYFEYGCALLELARMEQNVLGNALEGGQFTFFVLIPFCNIQV